MPSKELWPSQIQDLAFYMTHPRCMNLSDPGTGKTGSVCVYQYFLWKHKGVKTYWSMPKSLLKKNKRELLAFTEFTPEQIVIIDGTPNQRAFQMGDPRGVVFLMGFRRFTVDWKNLKAIHPQLKAVMIDEYHLGYKGWGTQATDALVACMKDSHYFLPMSGSIISGRLDSCYSAIHIIEPRYYTNMWSFRAQHAVLDLEGNIVGWQNHAKIGRIFKTHGVRHTFEEVHGEKKIAPFEMELCEMHPKQREAYEEFEEKAILELDDKFLEGTNPAVNAMRCRQIMQHPETFGILKPGELTGKDEALLVHLEDHRNRKEPLVIFSVLIPEQERIAALCRKEGFRVGLINANTPSNKRDHIDLAFQNGELDIVVCSPPTAGVGFNWPHVNHMIFMSLNYLDTDINQAIMRAVRGARTTYLRVTIFEYEDSIDQRIFFLVNRKSKDAHKVDDTYKPLNIGVKKDVPIGPIKI